MNKIRATRIILTFVVLIIIIIAFIKMWDSSNSMDSNLNQNNTSESSIQHQHSSFDPNSQLSINWDQIKKCITDIPELQGTQLTNALYSYLSSSKEIKSKTLQLEIAFENGNEEEENIKLFSPTPDKWKIEHNGISPDGNPLRIMEYDFEDFDSSMKRLDLIVKEFRILNSKETTISTSENFNFKSTLINGEAIEVLYSDKNENSLLCSYDKGGQKCSCSK